MMGDNNIAAKGSEKLLMYSKPRRNLALYPDCAVLQALEDREVCCDTKVKSSAGRNFCYNDVTYPDGHFSDCFHDGDVVWIFTCCEDVGGTNLSKAYSCKQELLAEAESKCFNTDLAC
mmetsp:Transcript_35556/g.46786  ORF Transcript_35556/g.46786 Transcript_35556/m.46786 type:complete len:118 (+) Transcript_35556:16-369(+)